MNARGAIAAQLTPPGRGAVATIVVRGPQASAIVERFFVKAFPGRTAWQVNRIVFGRWQRDAAHPGEELVVCRTGEEAFEVHCHGGTVAAEAILADLQNAGAEIMPWQGALAASDAIAAAALVALAEARTERTAAILLDQYRGALARELEAIEKRLADRDAADALARIDRLLERWTIGQRLTQPFQVVLAGPPNVGKSTLINALVGYERSIVFDQPGTTRDVVSALTAFDGWPVLLSDTAGLRETADALEATGARRARQQLEAADLVLWVRECTAGSRADAAQQPPALAPPSLLVFNKSDLLDRPAHSDSDDEVLVSALQGQGLETLKQTIVRRLVPQPPRPGEAVPFTPGQRDELQRLRRAAAVGERS